MKDGWGRYATKERFKQKGYFRKHCDGGSGREARQASRRDSLLDSWKKQKEKVKEYSCREGHQFNADEATHTICGGYACPKCPTNKYMGKIEKEEAIQWYGKVVQLAEEVIYTGDKDDNSRTDGDGDSQPQSSEGIIVASQPVRGKRTKRRRKTDDTKRNSEEV